MPGAHGAGLTNMIFAPATASVIELPLEPHYNRDYGFMAMALDLDYWVAPQVSARCNLHYNMTANKADAVTGLVRRLLLRKGLGHVLREPASAAWRQVAGIVWRRACTDVGLTGAVWNARAG